MAQSALALVLVYWIVTVIDPYFLSWQCLNRPIVIAPLAGLVLGHFETGIIMGASLESIFMGISAIGGSIPADATTSSIIAVAYTVLTGADVETGLAIALPIGTLMASFSGLLMPFFSSLAPYWERLAVKDIKSFTIQNLLFTAFIQNLVPAIILFIAVSVGIEGLYGLLASLPGWVMTGLGAATGMMLAVGFAILTSMIWSADIAIFFFVGYVLTIFAGLSTLPIAILGLAIAVTTFMGEKRIIDLKNSLVKTGDKSAEEDFF
jgi:Phosphotransferase system, mannose/fructose/N-acetylgalactosamine-specific component IIC